MTGIDPDRDGIKKKKNMLDKTHAFIDSHIRLVQNSIYVVAGVGIILIARSIHLTKIFTQVKDVPKHFITSHMKLLGKVTEIGEFGILHIQHIPIVDMKVPFRPKKTVDPLPVHLGFINVGPHGRKWLIDNVHNKKVWFKLLYVDTTTEKSQLYTAVEVPKLLRNIHVNEELIKQGLCRVTFLNKDYSSFSGDKFLLKFVDRLVQLESVASRKKIGLWGSPEIHRKKKSRHLKSTVNFLISFVSSPYYVIKWIIKKLKK